MVGFECLSDLNALIVTPVAQNFYQSLFISPEAFHRRIQSVRISFGVEICHRADCWNLSKHNTSIYRYSVIFYHFNVPLF